MSFCAKPTDRAIPSLLMGTYKVCAWCGEAIVGTGFERHHWFIKRGYLPKRRYPDIDVVINVVPLHHDCHQRYGPTEEMTDRCHRMVTAIFGIGSIESWWEDTRG